MSDNKQFDLVIIGSGPGGYTAAVKAAQLGMKTACVEKEDRLGGVCLNVGCIPSKALLDSSEYYSQAQNSFADHGIKIKGLAFDLAVMMQRKNRVVEEITSQVRDLLESNKVTIFHGMGSLAGKNRVLVKNGKKETFLQAKNILLATGSAPVEIPGLKFDGQTIVDSTGALAFEAVPKHLVVVGGGAIGLELGSVWKRLGAKVTVVEMLPKIAGPMDGQVSRTLLRSLKNQGLEIELNTRVEKAKKTKTGVTLTLDKKGKKETLRCDRVLVAVGRKPLTRGLALETAGVALDAQGRVTVDGDYQTSVKNVFAIGDLIEGPMLAHKAGAEAIAVVEGMAKIPSEVNYNALPGIVYTWPEAAGVGFTEEELKKNTTPYISGSFPFTAVGRARALGEMEGFAKVLCHKKTGRILGVHILGPRASDLIAEAALALEAGASAEDMGRTIHGHPTFSEVLQEAARNAAEA